jgi:hypothetical protein
MRSEFDVLEDDRLAWAAGCLVVSVGWRLRAEWQYLVLLGLAPVIGTAAVVATAGVVPHDLQRNYGPTLAMLMTALPALSLGAYRPRRLWASVIGLVVLTQLPGEIFFFSAQGVSGLVWWLHPKATLYMAPPFVGLAAELGATYAAAALGARFGVRCRR